MKPELSTLTTETFRSLPLVAEGESKEVRYYGDGQVVIRLKPTIYSYTHNRTGEIPGSDTARLRVIQSLLPVLLSAGIAHSYKSVTDTWILSDLVLQPITKNEKRFVPTDMTDEALAELSIAPPVEVVAKAVHSGTPKHRYYNFENYPTRLEGTYVGPEANYPAPFIRFDWRNPMYDATGTRLADEVLPEPMANWFIDVDEARKTAITAYAALRKHFQAKGLDLWDICFFVAEDGKKMFGEVSPDCMRVRSLGAESLDKDIWRRGGSSDVVLEKWNKLADILSA